MDAVDVVKAFNDRINARDLAGLTVLMTEDHAFVDPDGTVLSGRDACTEAWRGFFAAFPDYRNVFERMSTDGGTVHVSGHSICAEPALAGPAVWTVEVRGDRVSRWRVTTA